MNLGLGGKNEAVSRSPYSQTSLAAPTTKPRSFYSSAKPRCFLIKYVASRKSARCNKCTRSLSPLPSLCLAAGDQGGSEGGWWMHLLWDPRTLLILIQPTPLSVVRLSPSPSRQDRHRRLEFASTQQPSLLLSCKPLSQRLRWGVSSNNAGNLPPSSLPPSYAACNARPLARSSLSYMAIGSCWDRWGRLYSCRRRSRRSRRTHSLPTCESPVVCIVGNAKEVESFLQ